MTLMNYTCCFGKRVHLNPTDLNIASVTRISERWGGLRSLASSIDITQLELQSTRTCSLASPFTRGGADYTLHARVRYIYLTRLNFMLCIIYGAFDCLICATASAEGFAP